MIGGGAVEKEREVWDFQVFWSTITVIVDGRIRDVVDWWKSLRDFSILNMIDFFEGSDG